MKKPKERVKLEKDIENDICDYAKSIGMMACKFTSPNRRSVPDRMFISKTGVIFFIEFKRGGCVPTEAQNREIARLVERNVPVYVVDNVFYGKLIVDSHHAQ